MLRRYGGGSADKADMGFFTVMVPAIAFSSIPMSTALQLYSDSMTILM